MVVQLESQAQVLWGPIQIVRHDDWVMRPGCVVQGVRRQSPSVQISSIRVCLYPKSRMRMARSPCRF